MSPSFNSPYDLTDRRAAGHPNGHCHECGRPAASLRADYCSPACRDRGRERQAREEAMALQRERHDELLEEAQAVTGPEDEAEDRD